MFHSERLFQPELSSRKSINMVKVLSFSFGQCFCPFPTLLVEGSSEARLLRDLYNHVFQVCKFKNTSAMTVIFFMKMFKIECKFTKCKKKKKNWEKFFRLWDNCIWKGCNKLPLLRRNYLSSAISGLKNSPKILNTTQTEFLNPNCLHRVQ